MWKDKYKIGVAEIDQQHEELFRRVSTFIQTVRKSGTWEEKAENVKETISFMQAYVVDHFNDEESYLEKIGYPDLKKHKEAHEEFKRAVQEYVQRFEQEGYPEEVALEFGGKLMTWLIMHVASMDQKIGRYVVKQGGDSR
ncbi:bacteriohemerythrin [Heliorestis convoluta]|uniref:Bacteriohemerythrin n=1 Tax=Heliorestis convoluta TaxID=356322 RepID=A0A5Q2N7Q8_9FIRM|nr:bacteriohemerythrin [Heliorestis convoluta]